MTVTNKTGVFSLEKITDRQSNNKWSTILDPYIFNRTPVGTDFGYFGGGYNPSRVQSGINRIDYSNDTATGSQISHFTGGSPYSQLRSLFGVASLTHAYWGGGTNTVGSESTSIFRLDLSNDTTNAPQTGSLSAVGQDFSAVGNSSYGYICGDSKSRVDRIDYSNDNTQTAVKGNLNQTRVYPGATGNPSYGWFGGGGFSRSSIDRIDYGNDTATASARGPLNRSNPTEIAATGNANFGYWGGGGPGNTTYVDRVDYSNDTATATPKGPLSVARDKHGATGNADFGYFAAGLPGPKSHVDRIDYSNDTAIASPKGPLNITPGINGKEYLAGASSRANGLPTVSGDPVNGTPIPSNGPNTGYSAGGWHPSPYDGGMTLVDRIDYANDTAQASSKGNLPSGFYSWGNTGTSTLNYGYVTSGYNFNPSNPPTGMKTTLMRTDYSNDTASPTLRGGLLQQKYYAAAMGNNDFGYWGGGDPSPRDKLQRFDWSNDSANSVLKTPFSGNRYNMGANGTPSYAYFGGGSTPSNSSMIERLDLSNDDSAVVQKGSLQRTASKTAGTASPAFGYWTQVSSSASTYIERLDFANDTNDAVYKGPLSAARRYHGMIGSRDYGYIFCGQVNYPSNVVSSTDRLDFNNDTTVASPKGPMSSDRTAQGGTFSSRANALAAPQRVRFIDSAPVPKGYFAGGFNNNTVPSPSRLSSIERYDFDNDTNTASQVGSLINNGMYEGGGISSPAFSYFIGGSGVGPNTSTGPYMTTIQRLDLTNETFTTRGNTSGIWHRINVTGNANYGYISGSNRNTPWPYGSKIERIDFSNDNGTGTMPGAVSTFSAAQGGPRAAVSSNNYGYYGGGHTPSPLSTVERLDFGNDTSNLVTKGPLSVARQGLGALASPAYGYFGGGIANPGGTYYSTIDRIDFANDTAVASPKSILTVIKKQFTGVSNSSYGYFSGGYNIVPGGNNYLSSTDRIDFANDTANTVSKGTLTFPKDRLAGTSAILAAPPAPVQPPFPSPQLLPVPNYPFTLHTFTAANIKGRIGPTLSDFQSAYSGITWLATYFDSSNGIQLWTPPVDGVYEIELRGASGGDNNGASGNSNSNQADPGQGALLIVRVTLSGSTEYSLVVGQTPRSSNGAGSAGGGGSWIYTGSIGGNGLIAVAGGGAGWGHGNSGTNGGNGLGGSSTTDSTRVSQNAVVNGRTGNGTGATNGIGQGGGLATTGNYGGASGGAGWLSDGTDNNPARTSPGWTSTGGHSAGTGASDAWQGGTGRGEAYNYAGGFGGGGGSSGDGKAGGGGGGYTGGAAANDWSGSRWGNGGGGGTYYSPAATLVSVTAGDNGGAGGHLASDATNGYIKITLIG